MTVTIAACAIPSVMIAHPLWFVSRPFHVYVLHHALLGLAMAAAFACALPLVYSAAYREWQSWTAWRTPLLTRTTWLLLAAVFAVSLLQLLPLRHLDVHVVPGVLRFKFALPWALPTVLVATVEEMLFRGFVLDGFSQRFTFPIANAVQALCFTLAHSGRYVFYQHDGMAMLAKVGTAIFVTALIWGGLRRASGSFWLPIAAHWLFDTL